MPQTQKLKLFSEKLYSLFLLFCFCLLLGSVADADIDFLKIKDGSHALNAISQYPGMTAHDFLDPIHPLNTKKRGENWPDRLTFTPVVNLDLADFHELRQSQGRWNLSYHCNGKRVYADQMVNQYIHADGYIKEGIQHTYVDPENFITHWIAPLTEGINGIADQHWQILSAEEEEEDFFKITQKSTERGITQTTSLYHVVVVNETGEFAIESVSNENHSYTYFAHTCEDDGATYRLQVLFVPAPAMF